MPKFNCVSNKKIIFNISSMKNKFKKYSFNSLTTTYIILFVNIKEMKEETIFIIFEINFIKKMFNKKIKVRNFYLIKKINLIIALILN